MGPVAPHLLALWAKSGDPSHCLLGHMLDTAAVTLTILRREPATSHGLYACALGLSEEASLRFLAAVTGAHDIGKATPAFQRVWEEGRQQAEVTGFPFPKTRPPDKRKGDRVSHSALTEFLLHELLLGLGLPRRLARALARGLGAHHGFVAQQGELSLGQVPSLRGTGLWEEARRDLMAVLFETVGAGDLPKVEQPPYEAVLAATALASFADWIASDPKFFPCGRDASHPATYWNHALCLAQKALDAIGWTPKAPLVEERLAFESVFPGKEPNALQVSVRTALQEVKEPVLLVIEAPMGTGKTEAALYAHLELQRRLRHRGLYMALPTMATGNGMLPRLKAFLEKLPREGVPIDLQLQHGAAWLNPQFEALRPKAVGDAADGEEPAVVAREWFSARKRAMLSEYGVGTVDQGLLGVLRVRHHFIRLWGLGNRTVVLDEVHAYDAYTSGLIEALLRWLKLLGSSVILMSATLPRSRRHELLKAYGGQPPQQEARYPRLTVVQGERTESHAVEMPGRNGSSAKGSSPQKTLWIEAAPRAVDQLAAVARQEAGAGGCVACIVNTVERAQCLYEAFESGEPLIRDGQPVGKRVGEMEVYLFHARFPAVERQHREEACLELFGKAGYEKGVRPGKAVLVATQVAEQSLDLDFDAMFSDLAPVDLLLQRAGRLHRFDLKEVFRESDRPRARPPRHLAPKLRVAGLGEEPPDLDADHWGRVYYPYLLWMTWWALRAVKSVMLPEDLEPLVEAVYEAGIPDALPSEWRSRFEGAQQEFNRCLEKQRDWARKAAVGEPSDLLAEVSSDFVSMLQIEDDEESQHSQVPLTRLGNPAVTVVPLFRLHGGLCLDREGRLSAVLKGELTDEQAKEIVRRAVRLDRREIYRELVKQDPPPAWRRHPLLRRVRALVVEGDEARVGGTRIVLHRELGIIYG